MYSERSSNRLHLSSHANVRSPRSRNACIAALNHRLRPRLGLVRLRGFSLMEGSVAVSVFGHGQALPLHARIQSPAEEGEDAMVAAFAPGAPLGQGEGREEKWRELRGGEWDGNR